jgi:hypothetical protein
MAQVRFEPMGQAILAGTSTAPIPGGDRLGEVRVVQPVVGGFLALIPGRLGFALMLDGEGVTMADGELGLGAWGEGFVDRRHPHTYLHEAMLEITLGRKGLGAGIGAGKGFVPFGTDDPMSRPPLRYPVNHHWSQVLERAVVMGQVAWHWLTIEGALFNGDEPATPSSTPNLERFGDSWSVRVLAAPLAGLELQSSHALVHSPEHRGGAGLDAAKWSASARFERPLGQTPVYGLVEWTRTDEAAGAFRFDSWLAEGAVGLGQVRPYYRFERTERPEEERVSAFRLLTPPLEDAILGTSRWTIHTLGARANLLSSRIAWSLEPFIEGSTGSIAKVGGGLFQVRDWYRDDHFWSLTAGIRVGLGMLGHRMGRYGVLANYHGGAHAVH